jgi:hypothetical protein
LGWLGPSLRNPFGLPCLTKGEIMADTSSPADFEDAASAKAWLKDRICPRLEALHSCYVNWIGNSATNTNVVRTSVLSQVDVPAQLSLIRQDIIVVRDWALRNTLPDIPLAPSAFSDREEAQSAFSNWCAYLDQAVVPIRPSAFRLACNAACGCISNLAELRLLCQSYREEGIGKWHCDGIAGRLLGLTYHLNRARRTYPTVAWTIRTLYNEPPEPVAGVSGAA